MKSSIVKSILYVVCFIFFIFLAFNAQAQDFTQVANPSPEGPDCVWADYDGDGDLDILVTGKNNTVLMRNDCGVYVNSGISFPALAQTSFADWEDFDKDGDPDLLLSGDDLSDGPPYVTIIYRNENGVFVDIGADLLPMRMAHGDWGDFDQDGDIDLVMTGHFGPANVSGFATRLYRNDSGVFTQLDIGLPGVRSGVIAWADYDNDTDLDLLLAGPLTCAAVPQVCNSDPYAEIFRNDAGVFTAIGAGIEPHFKATSAAWGDYDNDNDPDFVIMGQTALGYTTRLYANNAGTFAEVASGLPNARAGQQGVAWGDVDDDGDLDILLGGDAGGDGGVLAVYRNTDGNFSLITNLIPTINAGRVNWGDSDNDGDLDILASGFLPFTATAVTAVYHNNSNPNPGLLENNGFENGIPPWVFYSNGRATFTNAAAGVASCHAAEVIIASPAGTNRQLYQTGMVLEPLTRYRLSFSAYSTTGHDLAVVLQRHTSPFTIYGLYWNVDLGTSWQQFVKEFVTGGFTTITENGRLRFSFAGAAGDHFYVDDVILEKVGNTSPIIVSHPENKTVAKFQTATFAVVAGGSTPLSYQWQQDNVNIPYATNASYTTPPVALADDGSQFRCIVTNPYGTAQSNSATLSVMAAVSVVANSSFEGGTDNWTFYTNGAGNFSTYPHHNTYGENCAKVSIITAGTNVQLHQSGLYLESYTTYTLAFQARSGTGHNMAVFLQKHTSPYNNFGLNNWVVDLTTEWQSFARTFTTTGFASATNDARLRFWFAPYDASGDEFFIDDVWFVKTGPGKGTTPAELPSAFALHQNYPNPFNPVTVVSYDLPVTSQVSLKVYDLLGKEIATLVDGIQEAGYKSVEFDATILASGVYFYRLTAGDVVATKKLVVLK